MRRKGGGDLLRAACAALRPDPLRARQVCQPSSLFARERNRDVAFFVSPGNLLGSSEADEEVATVSTIVPGTTTFDQHSTSRGAFRQGGMVTWLSKDPNTARRDVRTGHRIAKGICWYFSYMAVTSLAPSSVMSVPSTCKWRVDHVRTVHCIANVEDDRADARPRARNRSPRHLPAWLYPAGTTPLLCELKAGQAKSNRRTALVQADEVT
eukprot:270444-Rhodomonas_salina.2